MSILRNKIISLGMTAVMVASMIPATLATNVSASTVSDNYVVDINNDYEQYTNEGVCGFVERMYTVVLGRGAEPEGFNTWYTVLVTGQYTGAEVAYGFLESEEFVSKNTTNEEYVSILYSLFFDRAGDPDGIATWMGLLESGTNRHDICQGFINSTEWANTCLRFGINSGGTGTPDIEPEPTEGMELFVTALYNECLDREPDADGFNTWTTALAKREMSGKQVAFGFFFSSEFMNKASLMTDEEVIEIFYIVFLNRSADPDGLDTWLNVMAWGGGLSDLFSGFADSYEFSQKCISYGIVPGEHINVPSTNIDPDFRYFCNSWDVTRGMERLASATNLSSHTTYMEYDVQGANTVATTQTISTRDLQVLQSFAQTHFMPGWSNAQKIAYTAWWINRNVTYGGSRGGYAESIFVYKSGQCAQYNGALIEMMCYLGYDACMIKGYRGSNPNGGSQHFWGEVNINGETYVLEVGNYGHDGDWHYFVCRYDETRKYIKNRTLMGI